MKAAKYLSMGIYGLVVLVSAALLVVDPVGLDVVPFIIPVIAVLFISSLGFSYSFASKNSSKAMVYLGTVLLSVVFAALAFFAIAAVAWFVAVAHAQ